MASFDIKNETLELSGLISKIKKDNINIEERTRRINEIIKKLDNTVWDSPEKKLIEEEFFPFVDKSVNYISTILADCTNVLENANEKYKTSNSILNKNATNLENFKGV